jgi:hypothetical protein
MILQPYISAKYLYDRSSSSTSISIVILGDDPNPFAIFQGLQQSTSAFFSLPLLFFIVSPTFLAFQMNSESGPADEVAIKEKSRVVNPYLQSSTNPLRIHVNPPKQPAMGLNSKQRVGAIKASKRFGSERNKLLNKKKKTHKKNSLGVSQQGSSIDPVCFNPKRHCVVCRAVSLGCAKPHRAHHELCNRNTTTKGRVQIL